jgi:uncharacterized membrane protein
MVRATVGVLVLLGTGVVTGVLFAVAISVMPALIAMSPSRYVDTHKLLGRYYDRIMPVIVLFSVLGDGYLAATAESGQRRVLFVLGAVAMAGVAVVSQTRNVPINNQVKATASEEIDADWSDPRLPWRNWNLVRTACAAAGCVLTASAVVAS